MEKLQIGWFSTGQGEASCKLLTVVKKEIDKGKLNIDISFVFSNREPGDDEGSDTFLKLVKKYHLPLVCFSSKKFQSPNGYKRFSDPWRLEYDREVMKRLEEPLADSSVNLCVLAGYILIVAKEMCQRYSMINLHPAAPGGPIGTWQEVIWKLIEKRATESGVMIHLVTPNLDKGPLVTFCTFPIRDDINRASWEAVERGMRSDRQILFEDIRRRGLQRETFLIVATLKAFSQSRLGITKSGIVDFKGEGIPGYNLGPEIDDLLEVAKLG